MILVDSGKFLVLATFAVIVSSRTSTDEFPLTDITFLPRSVHAHDILVQKVSQLADGSIIQGVKHPSPMQDLLNFHPVNSLPPDLMHDFCEGI